MTDIEKMLKDFDEEVIFDPISKRKGKRKEITTWPYVDMLAKRKKIIAEGEGEEFEDIFRADGRIACYATRSGIETKVNKGWQILRYGNFEKFSSYDAVADETIGPESEEIQELKNLCDMAINVRKSVTEQIGIADKLAKKTAKGAAANVGA